MVKSQITLPPEAELAAWRADPERLAAVGRAYCDDVPVTFSGDAKDSGG